MRALQAMAERLVSLGVTHAFTFTAEDIIDLVAELDARGVTVHHTRHEHIAIGMADGYSRASGRVGVAIVGAGVGLTNAMNALLTATKAHSRVLVLSGEAPGGQTHAASIQRKHSDQRAMLDAVKVEHIDLETADSAAADIEACFVLARDGGEAIVVNMPEEVMQGEAGTASSRIDVGAARTLPLSDADRETIVEILEEPLASRRTVILAGRGAVKAGARAELVRLAEATGALLATTLMARQLFAGEAYNAGVSGNFATPVASELFGTADLVLAFGASLNYDTTFDGAIFGKARVVHIDSKASAIGRFQQVDLAVIADAKLAAAALADELERRKHHAEGYRAGDVAERIAAFRFADGIVDRSGPGGIDNRSLMAALDRALPAARAIVVDGGSQKRYAVRYLSVPDPQGFIWMTEHGAIGCGLGGALGVAVAHPDRLTVLCIGDGALMMTLTDLDTATRYRLPLLIVVSNNAGLAAEYHKLVERGYPGEQVLYANPSFEAVARALGYEAATINTLADLEAVRSQLGSLRGPMLLDCRTLLDRLEDPGTTFARVKARQASAKATGAGAPVAV